MFEVTLAAFVLAPALAAPASAPAPTSTQEGPLFAPARKAMVLAGGGEDAVMTYYDLVEQYESLTDQVALFTEDTKNVLRQRPLPANGELSIAPDRVQLAFESLMRSGDFVVIPPKTLDIPVFEIVNLSGMGRSNIRSRTTMIDSGQLDLADAHPAVLFTVSIDLPNTDVRQLSNSMRTMITDANVQQMLPAGNSHSMVLVGFGDQIGGFARTLRLIDEAAGVEQKMRQRSVEVLTLKHADATSLAGICGMVFGDGHGAKGQPAAPRASSILIVPDERTNSLVVRGTAVEQARVADLVTALDKPAASKKK